MPYRLLFIAVLLTAPATAGPLEEDAFAAFETFCIFKLDVPTEIPGMVEYIGARELFGSQATPYLGQQKGRAWLMRRDFPFALVLADDGTCGLYSPESDPATVRGILRQYQAAMFSASEPIGTEQREIYLLVAARKDGGPDFRAAIMLRTSKFQSIKGTFLSAIPERVLKANKAEPPSWPKPWRPN